MELYWGSGTRMKDIVVHFLPAEAGDCSVLEFDNKECIIIDCGYKSTYYNELKPLLIALKNKGCKVTLLIITHIDQDHIEGAVELISENGDASNPRIIEIENIWFNGFANTIFANEIYDRHKKIQLSDMQRSKIKHVNGQLEMQTASMSGNISANHSKRFEKLCLLHGYKMNNQFRQEVAKRCCENATDVFGDTKNIGDARLTVLAPDVSSINKLAKRFHIELIKMFGKDYSMPVDEDFSYIFEKFGMFIYDSDDIPVNISASRKELEGWVGTSNLAKMNDINKASIVVKIEYKGYALLFTGDSDSDDWEEFLEDEYELIKISHHGTLKPNQKIIERSVAVHTLISTNGMRGNHPENDLIARLILNGNDKIYFNYSVKQKNMLLQEQEKYDFQAFFEKREIELGEDNNERIHS